MAEKLFEEALAKAEIKKTSKFFPQEFLDMDGDQHPKTPFRHVKKLGLI